MVTLQLVDFLGESVLAAADAVVVAAMSRMRGL
jgi:hypothetical protein